MIFPFRKLLHADYENDWEAVVPACMSKHVSNYSIYSITDDSELG